VGLVRLYIFNGEVENLTVDVVTFCDYPSLSFASSGGCGMLETHQQLAFRSFWGTSIPGRYPGRSACELSHQEGATVSSCFTCQTNPSGNTKGGPHSAYCETCQPWPGKSLLGGIRTQAAECARCGYCFTTDSNFDRHIRGGQHIQPERAGLELKPSGRWGQPGRSA
jgi:hypothetical protein